MSTLLATLRCGSCRFAAIYFLPFYVALLSTGHGGWAWAAFGAAFWFLVSLGVELVNRLSDRVEDRVNRPERTALCEQVGFARLKRLSVALWGVITAVFVAWLVLQPNLVLAILLCLALLASINYSYGYRFKTRRYLPYFVLTFPFGGSFLIGWSVASPLRSAGEALRDLAFHTGPFLLVVGLFFGTFAGVKDVTDVEGDVRAGYSSFWLWLVLRRTRWVAPALVSVPFVALVLLVAAGLLTPRFLWLLPFLPVSLAAVRCVRTAGDRDSREVVREFSYHYWMLFLCTALYLFVPAPATLGAVAGATIYWTVTSQYLHWSDGIRMWKVKRLVEMVCGPLSLPRVRGSSMLRNRP